MNQFHMVTFQRLLKKMNCLKVFQQPARSRFRIVSKKSKLTQSHKVTIPRSKLCLMSPPKLLTIRRQKTNASLL